MSAPVALYPGLGTYNAALCRAGECAERQCTIIEYADGTHGLIHRGAICAGAEAEDPRHDYRGRGAKLVGGKPALVQVCHSCHLEHVLC